MVILPFADDDEDETDSGAAAPQTLGNSPPVLPSFSFDDSPVGGWPGGSSRSWTFPTPPSLGPSVDSWNANAPDDDAGVPRVGPPLPPSLRPSRANRVTGEEIARNGFDYYTSLAAYNSGAGANIGGDDTETTRTLADAPAPPDGSSSTENTHPWLYPSPEELPGMTLGGSWLFDGPDSEAAPDTAPSPPAAESPPSTDFIPDPTLAPPSTMHDFEPPAAPAAPPPTPPGIPGLTDAGGADSRAVVDDDAASDDTGDSAPQETGQDSGPSDQDAWTKFDPQGLAEFPPDVMEHVNAAAMHLPPSLDAIGRMATLNYVGEEAQYNHDRDRFGKFHHAVYNYLAEQGWGVSIDRLRQKFGDYSDAIPSRLFPESWARHSEEHGIVGKIKNTLSNLDPIDHDTGPANLKLRTASVAGRDSTMAEVALTGKAILTDAGIAVYAALLVRNAQKDLAPLLAHHSNEYKIQIITDYLRQGAAPYWEENRRIREHMTPAQLADWKRNPETFRLPSGHMPRPLAPIHPINHSHLKQVEQSIRPIIWRPNNGD